MRTHASLILELHDVAFARIRFAASLALFLLVPGYALPVSIQGRQIVVDGKPLFLKGVNWNPVPKGSQQGNGGVHFRGFVESDSELMAAAGINAVRTYAPITDTSVLDILWRKGIFVLNTVYITGSSEPESVVKPVTMLKDHPAILMWVIGNEWNYNMLYSRLTFSEAMDRVGRVAKLIKSLDRSHPVASVYGMVPAVDQLNLLVDIDVWGLTAYTGLSFGNLFETWAARSSKPMFVAEYGADAYNAKTQSIDEADQAKATVVLTREVIGNSALDGGACSGSLLFELADEWWKDSKGSPSRHNRGGVAPGGGPFPDNVFNEEYWGLVSIDGTPRQAYRAYAEIQAPGARSGHLASGAAANITPAYRLKACGANPACVGHLGDCCPRKDNTFHSCCSTASKSLHWKRAPRPAAPEVTPNAHSHQTLWTAGPPPAHCEVDHVVPCCPDGDCGSCAGDQCCPSSKGSMTCPSASKALADGCIHPKLYDCTGRTGTVPPNNSTRTTAADRSASSPNNQTGRFHTLVTTSPSTTTRGSQRTTTSPDRSRHPISSATTTTTRNADPFDVRSPAVANIHRPFTHLEAPPLSHTTEPAVSISLHTTMKVLHTTMEVPHTTMKVPFVQERAGAWILGPEKASCSEVCRPAGGCVEGNWPMSRHEFMMIARDLGYACFDLADGGGKYDPSTQQGNCGWNWNGGRELLSSDDLLRSRCTAPAPAYTRRFCPCKSKLHTGHERARPQEPAVVTDKFPRGSWTFEEGTVPRGPSRDIFT